MSFTGFDAVALLFIMTVIGTWLLVSMIVCFVLDCAR